MAARIQQETRSRQSGVVLAVLLVLSLALVTMYAREGDEGPIHAVQRGMAGMASPLKVASGGISSTGQGVANRLADRQADPNSLTELREQNEQLRSTIASLEEYRLEALRLEGLLEMRTTYNAQGIPCRVLSHSLDSWNQMVTIDAGSADGVHAGLPVMGPSGLIGQVASTSEHTAEVRLLTDSASGVAVIVQSSREEGIVHGSLEGLLYLDDIGEEAEVEPGDVLLTSGLGGGYFKGIIVGTIVKVEGEAGATTRKIIVEPNEAASPLEEVYVITSMASPLAVDEDGEGEEDGQGGLADGGAGYYGTDDYAYTGYDSGQGQW